MSNLFPPTANRTFYRILGVLGALVILLLGGIYLQHFSGMAYEPQQPIQFSHKVHVGTLKMDCTYCHSTAEHSKTAGMPDTQSCMGCHTHILPDSPLIAPLRRAADPTYEHYTGEPVAWVMVNRLAAHAYFNHQAHVTRGVACVECHGDVSEMDVISADKNSKMRWCMDCHRNPSNSLRPLPFVTIPKWSWEKYLQSSDLKDEQGLPIQTREGLGKWLQHEWNIKPKTDCTTCHH